MRKSLDEPDKQSLLALLPEYSGYRIHISANPLTWGGVSTEQADRAAHRLAKMAEAQFTGVHINISVAPNTYPFSGQDASVLERIDNWLFDNGLDALTGV